MGIQPPYFRISLHLAVLFFAVLTSVGAQAPQDGDPGGLVIGRTQVGVVNFGDHRFSVLPESQNYLGDIPKFPSRWEFSVEPIFMPEFKADGTLNLVVHKNYDKQSKAKPGVTEYSVVTRVGIPLILSKRELFDAAAKSVTTYFKDLNYTFLSTQITTIPVKNVSVELSDLNNGPCKLVESNISAASSESEIYIWLNCVTVKPKDWPTDKELDATVAKLTDNLPFVNAELIITWNARAADIGGSNVELKAVKSTNLYAKLDGDANQPMLVTRNDLRKLAMEAAQEIYVDYRGVQSPRCTSEFVNDVLSHFKDEQRIEAGKFTSEMLRSTYKPEDINPDEIQKTMDRVVKSDSTKSDVHFDTGGGVSLFDVIKGDGHMNGSNFTDAAHNSDVEADFNGTKWVAKSVKVLQVNISDFTTNYRASCSDFSVGQSQPFAQKKMQLVFRADHWTADEKK